MASNQLAAATIICIFHGVLHSADYQASLGAQIKESVVEWGLILLGTEICPRVGKNNLVNQWRRRSGMMKIANWKEKTQNLPTNNSKSALFMNIIFMLSIIKNLFLELLVQSLDLLQSEIWELLLITRFLLGGNKAKTHCKLSSSIAKHEVKWTHLDKRM